MIDKAILTFHEKFKQYDLGESHPFRGDRFANAMRFFESQGLLSLSEISVVKPEPVSRKELLMVHDEEYVDLIFRLANEMKPYDIETPVSPEILEAALLIVGGGIACGKAVLKERLSEHFLWVVVIIMLERIMVVDFVCSMMWQF
jgi:acetoin utilization deacetylase AcuC-like enzyme